MNKLLQRIIKRAQVEQQIDPPKEQASEEYVLSEEERQSPKEHFDNFLNKLIEINICSPFIIGYAKKLNVISQITEDQWVAIDKLWLSAKYNSFEDKIEYIKSCAGIHDTTQLQADIITKNNVRNIIKFVESTIDSVDIRKVIPLLLEEVARLEYHSIEEILKFLSKQATAKQIEDFTIKHHNKLFWACDFLNFKRYYPDFNYKNVQLKVLEHPETITHSHDVLPRMYTSYHSIGAEVEPIINALVKLNHYTDLRGLADAATKAQLPFPYEKVAGILFEKDLKNKNQGDDQLSKWDLPLYIHYFYKFLSKKIITEHQYFCQSNHNDYNLGSLFGNKELEDKLDFDSLQKYIIENKRAYLIDNLRNYIAKSPKFDFATMQKIIENSNDLGYIERFAQIKSPKLNFGSIKKRYNDLVSRNISKNPDDLKNIVDQANSRTTAYYKEDNPDPVDKKLFIQELIDKKDWFTLRPDLISNIMINKLIKRYKNKKNKSFSNLYHESFKNNPAIVETINELGHRQTYETGQICQDNFLTNIIELSNNLDQYVKYLIRINAGSEIRHNSGVEIDIIRKAILNTKFNIEDSTSKELLEIINNIRSFSQNPEELRIKIKEMKDLNPELIDYEKFQTNEKIVSELIIKFNNSQPLLIKQWSPEHYAIKGLHTDYEMIKEFEAIKQYVKLAKKKIPKLMEMALSLPNGFEFKVLRYLDPRAFRMGTETACCQRLGGEGWTAAVDSYINPLAGVLILEYNGNLLSQSYFHYVPKDKGVILDNVEYNLQNMGEINIDRKALSKIYADYAAALKAKVPEISYVKCGAGADSYNKLLDNLFTWQKMEEDPRHFQFDEETYSDFDEDRHISLLDPTDELKAVPSPTPMPAAKRAETYIKTLTASLARQMFLRNLL